MAKLRRKAELILWWSEYQTKIISVTVLILSILIIIAGFYPLSSKVVLAEVRSISSSDTNIDSVPKATIYNFETGEVVISVPIGVSLTIGDKVEISQGKTVIGIYRYIFIKKVL